LHWVPSYVRSEFKKKTGLVINEYGEKIDEDSEENNNNKVSFEPKDPNDFMLNMKGPDLNQKGKQQKKEYTPIKSYRPSGNLVYDDELLSKIEGKFS
jgi:hypothetical protein